MAILRRIPIVLAAALIFPGALGACKAVSRTIGTSGARDVEPDQFIAYYERPRRDDEYWEYIGRVGDHYYMEYYRTTGRTYPEFAGEIRVPVASMPADFPASPQGRPYPDYALPEPVGDEDDAVLAPVPR